MSKQSFEIFRSDNYDINQGPFLYFRFLTRVGTWIPISVKIDSGADMSFFGKNHVDNLGIQNLEKGDLTNVTLANGKSFPAYIHRVDIEVLAPKLKIQIPIIFSPLRNTRALLGRKGFLENFGVILESDKISLFKQ